MKTVNADNQPHYAPVSRKILYTFLIVSFLPLLFLTGSVLYQSHVFYHEKVRNQLENLAKIHTLNIDTFLRERLSNIRFFTVNRSFEELSDEVYLQLMLQRLQDEYGPVFSDLGVVDENGIQIAYAGPFRLDRADYSEAQWFKNAISSPSYVSDVFLGLRGLPHFIVTVRKERRGKPWILRSTIDFRSFNTVVENLRIGKTGFAFILNKEGEFQTETLADVKVGKASYMALLEGDGHTVKDRIHFYERSDLTGTKTIYVTAPLKNGDWFLILQQLSGDAFSDLRKAQLFAFLNLILGSFAIIASGIVLSRVVRRRLIREDKEKELMNQQIVESGKLASLGELAAGIAHEINNPVAIMVEEAGWIGDLLAEETFQESENLDEFKRALKQINTQGIRCRDITQKLLSFARKSENRTAVVQINSLIDEVVGISSQHAKYNNVVIETQYTDGLPLIDVSQTEIQQVMLNLINNALDAMEKSGGRIQIGTRLEDGHVVIEVADNGPGIPETNLARIFDPFFTTKAVGRGTGLGLSICYGIVNRMGGQIKVKSAVGDGTSFYIYLPCGDTKKELYADDSQTQPPSTKE
ncbi:MAG: ATP-binding protein [Desulfobacterales bacterium]|jgi:two-component system NtrC family sensor kinase|nr:ATP-binding protein [Desulfobacterales bacterium]